MSDERLLDDAELPKGGKEMGFLDHLEELRWRIIWSLAGIVAGSIVVWIFRDWVMDGFLLKPAKDNHLVLQNLRPFGQIFLYMQVAMFGGIILSIPNLLLQVWLFIAPGLYPHERKYVRWIVVYSSFCFLAGVAFAYYVIVPGAFDFLANFGTTAIENNIAVDEYFNFLMSVMLGAGLVFELPMVSFFLSRIGVLTPRFMRKYWRHAVVVILIVASFITPTGDPYNLLILAIPMLGLYEISIWLAKFGYSTHRKQAAKRAAEE